MSDFGGWYCTWAYSQGFCLSLLSMASSSMVMLTWWCTVCNRRWIWKFKGHICMSLQLGLRTVIGWWLGVFYLIGIVVMIPIVLVLCVSKRWSLTFNVLRDCFGCGGSWSSRIDDIVWLGDLLSKNGLILIYLNDLMCLHLKHYFPNRITISCWSS